MNYVPNAKKILDIEKKGLEAIAEQLDDNFNKAVKLIIDSQNSNGKVVVIGIGKNWHISNKIVSTFNSTGTLAAVMHPIEAMHGDFGMLTKNDIVLAISYSGASEEITNLVPLIRKCSVKIISLTADPKSPLGQLSDFVLNTAIPEEACPFNMAPTTSTTSTLALGDALAMVVLESRGFKLKDYAERHPGGAIGRALLLKVKDIMRTNERFATILSGKSVKEAILAITAAKSGSVAVINNEGILEGILTDGDLRRHLVESPNLMELSINDIMQKSPITLNPDMLAADVLKLYEQNNVDDLIVVNEGGIAIGSVDIQDMPKLKIL